MAKSRVLITGATGFVGRSLIHRLIEQNEFIVRAFCRNPSTLSSEEKRGIEISQGDILSPSSLNSAMVEVDIVIHLAAEMNFFPDDPNKVFRVNVEGTKNVISSSIQNQVKRLVYISTAETYGSILGGKPATEASEYHPTSDYGKSKIQSEKVVREMCKGKMDYIILEPTGIYGPGDEFAMAEVIQSVNLGLLFFTAGDGGKHLTFTFIEDLLDSIVLSCNLNLPKEAINETYIIASGENWTYKDWITSIALLVGRLPPFLSLPVPLLKGAMLLLKPIMNVGKKRTFLFEVDTINRMNEDRWYDISKARRVLGWTPKTPTQKGLENTIQFMMEKGQMRRYFVSPLAVGFSFVLFLLLFFFMK